MSPFEFDLEERQCGKPADKTLKLSKAAGTSFPRPIDVQGTPGQRGAIVAGGRVESRGLSQTLPSADTVARAVPYIQKVFQNP